MSPYTTGSGARETNPEKLGMLAHLGESARNRASLLLQQREMFDQLSAVLAKTEQTLLEKSEYFNASAHQGPKKDTETAQVSIQPAVQSTDPSDIVQNAAVSSDDMRRAFQATNDQFSIG
jgi:hypothetical protein